MSKFSSESLKEARRVVSELVSETRKGTTFQFEGFIQGLSEEIADYWQPNIKEGLVHFRLVDDGSLLYEGICTEMVDGPADLYYSFGVKEGIAALENVTDEQLDVFTLLSSMKENHFKEKSKILESLDQISADFDKKLIEVIKKAKATKHSNENNSTKVAEDYLNLDIATKKQKLLEKLLEGK